MSPFQRAAFRLSVAQLSELPASQGEIAFAGRSNAGKSSALNTLTGRQRLAFVSRTPGRTQLINFFDLGDERFLVDLPGYGYAKVPSAIRAPWAELLSGYLRGRAPLRGMALVMDARRPLTELDRRMLAWFAPTGKPVHVLLTKADKLTRGESQATLRRVLAELAAMRPNWTAQLFSSLKKDGVDEAHATLGKWLGTESELRSPDGAAAGAENVAGDSGPAPHSAKPTK